MSGKLVNMFGDIALDETSRRLTELLEAILVELRVNNEHMARMRNEHIDADELDEGEFPV